MATQWPSRIVPAQLSFLAIYNPSLGGESDESFREQLVFYFSRSAHESRIAARRRARYDSAGGDGLREEENEKLRQIGLAQGMVDFAKTFSNGAPVDSIETEKSRIVLHELEKGWWILASIDLTRLPAITSSESSSKQSAATNKTTKTDEPQPKVECSSREVSPPALLVQQLILAHHVFALHHSPSLNDLFVRLTREKFCMTLDRFWTRFARNWDVLLHGNPAADIFSGIKLASGGELGFGVGEEEWGSGEREVLEDLIRRTDGLIDAVVSRFGDPARVQEQKHAAQQDDSPPWIGSGSQPSATDGVIFGGVGAMQRHSLRSISLWMRQIYTYGEQAYGVKDNPLRERRRRRRRHDPESANAENGQANASELVSHLDGRARRKNSETQKEDASSSTEASAPGDSTGVAQHSNGTMTASTGASGISNQTKIPPPIVSASNQLEHTANNEADQSTNAFGISDTYMKYLTLGLSTLGKQKTSSTAPSSPATQPSQSQSQRSSATKQLTNKDKESEAQPTLAQVDSVPDEKAVLARLARQKRQENRGHFVIGLKGDLLELDELSEEEQDENSDGSFGDDTDGSRIVLRTLMIEAMPPPEADENESEAYGGPSPLQSDHSFVNQSFQHFRRMRVLLYVHRPFMYCFLFETRTSSLQYSGFYKSLHRNMIPIHKPLLSSTSPAKVAQRIAASQETASAEQADTFSIQSSSTKTPSPTNTSPIYDLIYDPHRLTLHTSIPNIPEPGTPAAEGIFTSFTTATTETLSSWTRVEALNVHSQILGTLSSVKNKQAELERTSKTSRGWWIVWLRIPSSPNASQEEQQTADQSLVPASSVPISRTSTEKRDDEGEDMHRVAFLVRKASDAPAAPKQSSTGSRAMSSMLEVMSLGMAGKEEDSTGGAGAGWGPAALAGGIGIDARAYVEGLLSLNR